MKFIPIHPKIDLDWEFPNGSNAQRIHFMQLLHEIRREYQREHSTYLLSVAVAAPPAFVDMCYDVRMINENVDFVNLMTYDFHFYSKSTPYVGKCLPKPPNDSLELCPIASIGVKKKYPHNADNA